MIHFLQQCINVSDPEKMLDMESFNQFPAHVYLKSLKGKSLRYIGGNEQFAIDAGYESAKSLLGQTDFDVWPTVADKLIANDNKIFLMKKPMTFFVNGNMPDGSEIQAISQKIPLYNRKNKIHGVFGISLILKKGEESFIEPPSDAQHDEFNLLSRLVSPSRGIKFQGLSQRQSDCLYWLIKGMTMKMIAAELNLSIKTVEHYLDAVKAKLRCHTRAELIEKGIRLFKSEFVE